jgi:polyribonucleotide 5'-hydroxyl-kinase
VNAILVLGGERLYSEMKRLFTTPTGSDIMTVVRLDKSGGCVDREESYMRLFRQHQIRQYFFGLGNVNLSPYTTTVDFGQVSINRIRDISASTYDPGADDDDDDYEPQMTTSGAIYDKVNPSMMLQNSLLAITQADPQDNQEQIRDASVMGYVYVAEVDEAKRKIRLLSPVGGRVPSKAMVWGSWPEEVIDLVG